MNEQDKLRTTLGEEFPDRIEHLAWTTRGDPDQFESRAQALVRSTAGFWRVREREHLALIDPEGPC